MLCAYMCSILLANLNINIQYVAVYNCPRACPATWATARGHQQFPTLP